MANPKVHEVAADLGVTTDVALAKLKQMGEFIKSPSSSISPPVARKLKAALELDAEMRVARRNLLTQKRPFPARKPTPRRAARKRSQIAEPSPEQLANRESRAAAAAESQRIYEEKAAARRAADEAAGRKIATSSAPPPQKKRRWVKAIVSGGLPGLGRRR